MSTCNYRCVYCFWNDEALGAKISPPARGELLASFFDRSELTWLLHLTGGEPFMYPDFVKLCQLLVRQQFISINTNADSPRVREFADTVDPRRVDFINCSVHVQERGRRNGEKRLSANFAALRAAGFDVFASSVMYPDILPNFSDTWARYAERGIVLIPKALYGTHLGRSYPEDYTADERAIFVHFAQRATEADAEQFARRREPPTVNPFMDAELFLNRLPDHRGKLCNAGHRFVRIWGNGDIRRCGPQDVIGNVVEGWFERRPGPSRCAEMECRYFCEKYRVP